MSYVMVSSVKQDYSSPCTVPCQSMSITNTNDGKTSKTKIEVNPSIKGAAKGAAGGAIAGAILGPGGAAVGAVLGGMIGLIFGPDD